MQIYREEDSEEQIACREREEEKILTLLSWFPGETHTYSSVEIQDGEKQRLKHLCSKQFISESEKKLNSKENQDYLSDCSCFKHKLIILFIYC